MRYFYQPVSKEEEDKVTIPQDWRDYPALRPPALAGVKPPQGQILVKTGGNALQAIDRTALAQYNVVAVTVPWNTQPGEVILVRLPKDRMVRTRVPEGTQPGMVFLMKVPEPTAAIGVPVDWNGTKITPSKEVELAPSYMPPSDLQLTETGAWAGTTIDKQDTSSPALV